VALGLAERGAALTITGGSSQERLEKTLAELNIISNNDIANNLTGREKAENSGILCRIGGVEGFSPEKAASFILKRTDIPAILVLAWGSFKRIALQETKGEDWQFLTENNLIFPGIMISSVLSDMMNRGWGRILIFGGTKTAEIRGFSTTAAYSAAKTALGSLAMSTAKTAGKAGVCCNVICPGLTNTEYTGKEALAYNREKNPGGMVLTVKEIAECAFGILENPAINGAIIPVDGGLWV